MLARADAILLYISTPIVKEIEGVLQKKFKWTKARTQDALAMIASFTRRVIPEVSVEEISEDPPDNRILECALEAGADCIVSGDRHLRKLKEFRGIPIMSPREFLDSLA